MHDWLGLFCYPESAAGELFILEAGDLPHVGLACAPIGICGREAQVLDRHFFAKLLSTLCSLNKTAIFLIVLLLISYILN